MESAEIPSHRATIVGGDDGAESLYPALGHGRVDGIAATATDTEHADTIAVHIRQRHQIIGDAPEIFDALSWIFDRSRLAAACALETAVKGDDHKASLSQCLAIYITRGLFLATADGVSADDGRIFLCLIEIRREVNVCCDIPIHIGIVDGDSFHVISPLMGVEARWPGRFSEQLEELAVASSNPINNSR